MPIPGFQDLMLPLLQFLEGGNERSTKDIRSALAEKFQLTADELTQMLPSGKTRVFVNRVAWSLAHLKGAKLLASEKKAHYQMTDRGRSALDSSPERVDLAFLKQYPEYMAFRKGTSSGSTNPAPEDTSSQTAQERLESAFREINVALEEEILGVVKSCSPEFFEQLVVDVLLAMGYGGSLPDAGQAVGRSGDGGIDGLIKEDQLGLDMIYIQAKRWEGSVGSPEIQKFAGALQGRKAKKGVFITTSSFTANAVAFANDIEARLVLVDGPQLARLMIQHGVGVTIEETYAIQRLDQDYYSDE